MVCTKSSPLEKAAMDAQLSVISIRKPARHYAFLSAWMILQSLKKRGVTGLMIRNTSDISLSASIALLSFKRIHIHFFMELMFQTRKQQWYRTIRYSFLSSWVCSLEYMKEKVLSATHIDQKNVCVIPSGLDFSQILPFSKTEARQQLNLAEESDSYLSELQALIQEKKLVDQVHFYGFHAKTSPFYHAIDALIMASDLETFGMSTIEALAHNTPVIATNSGGSKELLTRFPFGILVDPGIPSSFASAMGKIAEMVPENFDKEAFHRCFDHQRVCEMIESRILSCESVR